MNCHDAKERLTEGRETAATRHHLGKCSDCASFAREVDQGGRDLAQAFLAVTPSAGFEERVARRMREEQILVRALPAGRLARVLAPALFLLLLVAGWYWFREGPEAPAPPPPAKRVAATPVTPPNLLFPLLIDVGRVRSESRTRLILRFAHDRRAAVLDPGAEDELLLAWARGARTVEMRIGPEVPTREVHRLVELLDRLGYGWEIERRKTSPLRVE